MESLRREAFKRGATEFGISRVRGKRFYVIYQGKRINFGAKGMSDFTQHRDPKRRELYHKRHKAIKLKDGTPAYLNKRQPAYWAFYLLWP